MGLATQPLNPGGFFYRFTWVVFFLVTLPLIARTDPALEKAWTTVTELSFNDAARQFEAIGQKQPELKREADYGLAIALLNAQPTTRTRIDRARTLLHEVKAVNSDDDTGIAAWFYLARIEQAHTQSRPNYESALAIYTELGEAHPEHYFGQFALLRQAAIELSVTLPTVKRPERFTYWAQRADEFTYPEFRRNLERVLVYAGLFSGMDSSILLKHSLNGVQMTYSREDIQTISMIRTCVLAMEAGENKTAKTIINGFLNKYPRHQNRELLLSFLNRIEEKEENP